jgi:uncharacterized protein
LRKGLSKFCDGRVSLGMTPLHSGSKLVRMAELPGLIERLQRALEPLSEVSAALLFGSHARGQVHSASDIDVALLLGAAARSEDRGELLRRLIAAIGQEVAADRVDLVVLNDAPPALAFQVLRYGKVVLVRDPVALHRFRVRTYSRHADYEPIERFFRRVTRARALGESTEPRDGGR